MRVDAAGRPLFFNQNKPGDCAVLTRPLVEAVRRVRGSCVQGAEHLEVRAPDADGRAGLFVAVPPSRSVPLPVLDGFVVGDASTSKAWQRWAVTDEVFSYVPLRAFLQVNERANRELVGELVRGAMVRGATTFADPYAGAGNHALALAAAGLSGFASDRHAPGIEALQQAAHEQGLDIETACGDADRVGVGRADLLVANPPRAGLRQAAARLAALQPRHVALVVCTTEALARDVGVFCEAGYVVEDVVAIDMFPHTEHVEVLAWLVSSARGR